ncbi:MAG: GxxExxY protein [Chloroflexi bacterium]|jgi:GxxExxY protein|nr:GxxExxY protein [Chloroflexota bacterium]
MDAKYTPLSDREEALATAVVDAAYQVHRELGPGLLESVYEAAFCHVLMKQGFEARRQVVVPIVFDSIKFDEGFRIDVLVENLVICELKSVASIAPVHTAQLLTYLKLTEKRLGFLINFNVPLIKKGIRRVIR